MGKPSIHFFRITVNLEQQEAFEPTYQQEVWLKVSEQRRTAEDKMFHHHNSQLNWQKMTLLTWMSHCLV